jgi:hypothetical protein
MDGKKEGRKAENSMKRDEDLGVAKCMSTVGQG